jgi:hypothetical protein
MTCHQDDLVFRALYGADLQLLCGIVDACFGRLGVNESCPREIDTARAWFVLLINRDPELRALALKGSKTVPSMQAKKAETFFLSLHEEVVAQWLSNETLPEQELLDRARMLYLAC